MSGAGGQGGAGARAAAEGDGQPTPPPVPPAAGKLVLVGGGARSGKSRFALELARRRGGPGIYLATAEPLDGEMADRIRRHRAERDAWAGAPLVTIEEPLALPEALDRAASAQAGAAVVLVDCLTLWVSNLLGRERSTGAAFDALEEVLDRRRGGAAEIILVTNEVGLGLVPPTPLGRAFRDATGFLHQRLARRADEVYAALMGMIVRLRPAPVEAFAAPDDPPPRPAPGARGEPGQDGGG